MKFNRFLMYGMIIFGVLMMGSASAQLITSVTPSSLDLYTLTEITVSLADNETNVTLSGVVSAGPTNSTGNTWVAFNVTATAGGTIYITADNGTVTDQETLIAGSSRPSRRNMIYTIAPESPAAGDLVTLTVLDKTREDGLDEVEVDVFFNDKKYAYGVTDDDGVFTFTPAEAGEYKVTFDRTNYRELSFEFMVSGEAVATTTTTKATTTTTAATTTTTEAAVTTTEAEVTTTTEAAATTTTTEAEVTTTSTTLAEEQAEGGLPILWIAIIVVVIAVVVYFVAVKGKGGAAEAPAEEAPVEETKEE